MEVLNCLFISVRKSKQFSDFGRAYPRKDMSDVGLTVQGLHGRTMASNLSDFRVVGW